MKLAADGMGTDVLAVLSKNVKPKRSPLPRIAGAAYVPETSAHG